MLTIITAICSLKPIRIGAGNVLVTVTSPNSVSRTIQLNFRNGKGGTNLPQTTINTTNLVPMMGGSVTSFANTTVEGGAYPEIQTITLSNATSGTWRVAYNGEISAALATSISAAALESALDAFVGIDNVTVTGSSGSFTVTFGGTQSQTNMSRCLGTQHTRVSAQDTKVDSDRGCSSEG
jgi:hypothetical protein